MSKYKDTTRKPNTLETHEKRQNERVNMAVIAKILEIFVMAFILGNVVAIIAHNL